MGTGKLVAIGAAAGALAGTAILVRKLMQRTDDDEREQDDYDEEQEQEDEEPRGRADEDEDEDDEEQDDEEDDGGGPRGRADDEDEEDEDYDEDEEDEPRGRYEDDEEDEDEEYAEVGSKTASRSRSSNGDDDDDDDRGLASTVWEAVVEGVRSGSGDREGKSGGNRASEGDDEEDDISDLKPRGASGNRRRPAAGAPRGKISRRDEGPGDDDGTSILGQARRHLADLTGHAVESLSGLERDGDGRVKVRGEVVELERIPHSTDVLATYELTLDGRGRLVDFSRVARYTRSSAEVGAR